jgi:integrase
MLGPEWPDKGAPPPGYYDRRSAQAALEAILTDARRGGIELARTGVTFEQAAIEWLRWGEHERGWKRSTLVDRRSALNHHLLPEFGALAVNQITTRRVEAWKIRWLAEHDARRQGAKMLAILHGIMERRARRMTCRVTRSPTWTAFASATTPRALTSTHPRRSTRSRARRRPSRTRRCF